MTELPPASHLAPRGREVRMPSPSPSLSPRERNVADSPIRWPSNDSPWVQLSPRYVAGTFRNRFDALDACMEAASAAEQSFAHGAATASSTIQEWVDELVAWPWPDGGGSAGFRAPSEDEDTDTTLQNKKIHMGSLLASEVRKYQKRIDDMSREMEDMGVEQMKARVLHDHIMPLSRAESGSPMCGSNRSATYAKMNDFTAFVTAIIVQALPNLSRLAQLMDIWSVRLLVLQRKPVLFRSLEDAEAALQSACITIKRDASGCPLSADEFKVMRSVVEKKVLRAGRTLDVMLDYLEGRQDTIPEEWIDRIDAIERDYARWVTACETRLRRSGWSALDAADDDDQPTSSQTLPQENESPPTVAGLDGSDDAHLLEDAEDVGSRAVRRLFSSSVREHPCAGADEEDEAELELPALPEECEAGTPSSQEPSSPPNFKISTRSGSVSFCDMPVVDEEMPDDKSLPRTPAMHDGAESPALHDSSKKKKKSVLGDDDQLQQQISEILESLPAKIRLTSEPSAIDLNPPDFKVPVPGQAQAPGQAPASSSSRPLNTKKSLHRSQSNLSMRSTLSSRAGTPSFLLAPAPRARQQRNQDIKLYHLSRKGEAPIKLFIRCVGEKGERVMVRVGGGWADLGEYLKDYASHHGRRSGGSGEAGHVEIKDIPAMPSRLGTGTGTGTGSGGKSASGSSPPARPASALELSPSTPLPLRVRKKRGSVDATDQGFSGAKPTESTRSRSSSHLSWAEEDSPLGMAGPRPRDFEMSESQSLWVQSVTERVRLASGEQRKAVTDATANAPDGQFGDLGKVGGTKRLFRRQF